MSHSAPDYAVEMMALPSPGYIEEVRKANEFANVLGRTAVVLHFPPTHKYRAVAESSAKRLVMSAEERGVLWSRRLPGGVGMTRAERDFALRCLRAVEAEWRNAVTWLESQGYTIEHHVCREFFIARHGVKAKCIDEFHFIRTAYALGMKPSYGLNDDRIALARKFDADRALRLLTPESHKYRLYLREQHDRERTAKAGAR